jgi:4-amino-4-deoxy-L-arabinose transferase-like glycosyltransferase
MRAFVTRFIQKKNFSLWVLGGIIALGGFFRLYAFREWLHFGQDQARDAWIAEQVVTGMTAWPLLGAEAGHTDFKIGPVYYYFQIVAEKLFGTDVSVAAYPDAFFSILAIPLTYFFLKRYFTMNLSFALTGLFACSFFVIEYSRFAWNPNSIPFFVLVFLLALMEFCLAYEKSLWRWPLLLGVAVGVGVQLHGLLLILMPSMLFVCGLFFLKSGRLAWRQWLVILGIALVCNTGQLIHEWQTEGANTRLLFTTYSDKSTGDEARLQESIRLNALCHVQAMTHILSSLGNEGTCDFDEVFSERRATGMRFWMPLGGVVLSIGFLCVCLAGLVEAWRTEQDRKRRFFLGVMSLYMVFSFLSMLSIWKDTKGTPLRYFVQEEIVALVLLGLAVVFLQRRCPRGYLWVVIPGFIFFLSSNIYTIAIEAERLSSGMRGNAGFVVLGQAEEMVNFIASHSRGAHEVILVAPPKYAPHFRSLQYIAYKKGFSVLTRDMKTVVPLQEVFILAKNVEPGETPDMRGYSILAYQNFGKMAVYVAVKE